MAFYVIDSHVRKSCNEKNKIFCFHWWESHFQLTFLELGTLKNSKTIKKLRCFYGKGLLKSEKILSTNGKVG
jgi:hypothetical protein